LLCRVARVCTLRAAGSAAAAAAPWQRTHAAAGQVW
jgi:hypothetical protein